LACQTARSRASGLIALGARAAQLGVALPGRVAPIADGAICSTLQIGSTPKASRCWSTKPSGLQSAVELRLGEKRAGQLQDLVGPAQLLDLALQILDALLLFGGLMPSRGRHRSRGA
jgi:hypothetical protein